MIRAECLGRDLVRAAVTLRGARAVIQILKNGAEPIYGRRKAGMGDDAADAMARHKGVAEASLRAFGTPAVGALKRVDTRGARMLAQLAASGELARTGRAGEVLGVVERYGDRAMAFFWRNKGALATTAVLTAFLSDPRPFIDGTRDVAQVAADAAVRPVAGVPAALVREAASRTNWTLVLLCVLGWFALRSAVRMVGKRVRRRRRNCPAPAGPASTAN